MDLEKVKKAVEEERTKNEELMINDLFDENARAEIVAMVINDVDDDIASRKVFLDNRKEIIDLYEGKRKKKKDPFPGCANVSTMLVAMVVELLHSKLFPAVYNDDLVHWIPQEKTDSKTAGKISKFMKWVLRKIGFKSFVDDFVKGLTLEGTIVAKIVWSEEYRWILRRIPRVKKFILALKKGMGQLLNIKGVNLEYEKKYDYVKFEQCDAQLLSLDDVGFPPYSVPGSDEDKLDHIWHRTRPFYKDVKQKIEKGFFVATEGLSEVVDKTLVAEGKLQKARIDAEGSALSTVYRNKYPMEQIEWYGKHQVPGMGYIECIFWVEKKFKKFLGAMPLIHLTKLNRRPFVIHQLIRRLNRMYGLTIADFIKEIQNETDTIHNQRLDAGTMSIVPPGGFRAASGMKPEQIKLAPGLLLPLDDVNDIKWFTMPNNVLTSFQEERMLLELAEKLSSLGSYQSGQESGIVKSRSTARGTLAIIAQGEQRFATLGFRTQDGLVKILNRILQSYQENMPADLDSRVLGYDGQPLFPEGLSPEDILGGYDCFMAMDATGGSKSAEREFRGWIYNMALQNPIVMSNPQGLWEVTANLFRSGNDPDVEKYIGKKPGKEGVVEEDVTLNDEITLIKEGRLPETKPGWNVYTHFVGLLSFQNSIEGKAMQPEHAEILKLRLFNLRTELLVVMQNMQENAQRQEAGQEAQGGVGNEGEGYSQVGQTGPVLEGTPAATARPGAQAPSAIG